MLPTIQSTWGREAVQKWIPHGARTGTRSSQNCTKSNNLRGGSNAKRETRCSVKNTGLAVYRFRQGEF